MKHKFFSALFSSALLSLLPTTQIPSFGSTVVAIPTQYGCVFVADKRSSYSDGRTDDNSTKIFSYGDTIIYGSVGTVDHFIPYRKVVNRFNINQIIHWTLTRNVPDEGDLISHRQEIVDAFRDAYGQLLGFVDRSKWHEHAEGTLAEQSVIVKYNRLTQKFEALVITVLIIPEAQPPIQVWCQELPSSALQKGASIVLGVDRMELMRGLPPYANVRTERWFERLFLHPVRTSEISKAEAFQAGVDIVRKVHKQQPQMVGESVDVLYLGSTGVETKLVNSSLHDAEAEVNKELIVAAVFPWIFYSVFASFVLLVAHRVYSIIRKVGQRVDIAHTNEKPKAKKKRARRG
ncbi:MAG: hypothetical protein C0508_00905 [Cyanobacteria bacterium PR.023]|nr:hypothetical protein [Cyanobacteria bacterium PR.3.49]MBA4073565.1 hypothetical protein [Cyanobacteria bacterium PR.023]